ANDRAAQARTFDRALRSLRPLSTSNEAAPGAPSAAAGEPQALVAAAPAPADASAAAAPTVRIESTGAADGGATDAAPRHAPRPGGLRRYPPRETSEPSVRDAGAASASDGAPVNVLDGGDESMPSLVPIDAAPPAPDAGAPPLV